MSEEDFIAFTEAVKKAEAKLRAFTTGAGRVIKALEQLERTFRAAKP